MHRSRFLPLAFLTLAFWMAPIQLVQSDDQSQTQSPKKVNAQDTKENKDSPDRRPDVVYWPTPQNVVDKMLELAEVKKGDVVYDLGCGDARILVTAAKKYGIEIKIDWLEVVDDPRLPHAVPPGSTAVWPQSTTAPSTAPTRLLPHTMLLPQTMLSSAMPQTMLLPQTMLSAQAAR